MEFTIVEHVGFLIDKTYFCTIYRDNKLVMIVDTLKEAKDYCQYTDWTAPVSHMINCTVTGRKWGKLRYFEGGIKGV